MNKLAVTAVLIGLATVENTNAAHVGQAKNKHTQLA